MPRTLRLFINNHRLHIVIKTEELGLLFFFSGQDEAEAGQEGRKHRALNKTE